VQLVQYAKPYGTGLPGVSGQSYLMRGIAGHIEQAERGAMRKSPQAHKHFCPLLPTAMVFVSYGLVLVQVQVPRNSYVPLAGPPFISREAKVRPRVTPREVMGFFYNTD
jgi:hypothetical protein